jgi:hypothetical protein
LFVLPILGACRAAKDIINNSIVLLKASLAVETHLGHPIVLNLVLLLLSLILQLQAQERLTDKFKRVDMSEVRQLTDTIFNRLHDKNVKYNLALRAVK